jgi:pimeloyl-ACP methyl ester carboxylesterase
VLVASGGLGREVSVFLRAVTLPGSELVLPLVASQPVLGVGAAVSRVLGRIGLQAGSDLAEIARGIASLNELGARRAFVHTARSVIDAGGQRVDARDRLYLAEAVPSLLVWGGIDPIIPARHGRRAHELMPGSRLEVFDGAGHFPHLDDPLRFVRLLREFATATEPAHVRPAQARELMLARAA